MQFSVAKEGKVEVFVRCPFCGGGRRMQGRDDGRREEVECEVEVGLLGLLETETETAGCMVSVVNLGSEDTVE